MIVRVQAGGSPVSTAAGAAVGFAGVVLAGMGLWARREVRRALAQERVAAAGDAGADGALVTTAAGARSMAELIRKNTVEATGGRTYAEVEAYLDESGNPTADAGSAAKDERTGQPLENPDHDLWVQSTTLQTALMQAYLGFRLAELMVALGAAFAAAGIGLAAGSRASPGRRARARA